MKKILVTFVFLFSFSAHADWLDQLKSGQTYIGGGVGYGTTQAPPTPSNINNQFVENNYRRSSSTASLFAGYRWKYFGLEFGAIHLPEDHTSAYTGNYPAYKGCAPGPTCPNTARISQDIYSRSVYLRANVYAPSVWQITPYAFWGKTKVNNYNHEYGNYNGTDQVDYKVSFENQTFIYGFGIQTDLSNTWAVRLETTRIPSATVEEHTRVRDVDFTSVNLIWKL